MKNIGIIIVSYHTGAVLFDCIDAAISQNSDKQDIGEIIIVDNGNDDATRLRLQSYGNKIKHIINPDNLGFGAACNIGAKASNCDILLFLNPDAILVENTLDSLALEPNQLMGGKIIDENGNEQRGARRGELTLKSAIMAYLGKDNFNQNNAPTINQIIPIPTITGALFAIHQSDFEKINGFDENYFLHVEDIDICKRFRQMGGQVFYNPNLIARHIGATSDAPKPIIEYYKFKGLMRYFLKFESIGGKIAALLIAPFLFAAMMLRAIIFAKKH